MQIAEYRRMDYHVIYIALFGILSHVFNLSVCVFLLCSHELFCIQLSYDGYWIYEMYVYKCISVLQVVELL